MIITESKASLGGSNRMMNAREVGDILGLPERTIRAQWKEWGLKTHRVGRALRWRERDLLDWIDKQVI